MEGAEFPDYMSFRKDSEILSTLEKNRNGKHFKTR